MKELLTYIILAMPTCKEVAFKSVRTVPYTAKWTTAVELGVVSYQVQQSLDSSVWKSLATVAPKRLDFNSYSYTLPPATAWYRVRAYMKSGAAYYTRPVLMTADSLVMITGMRVRSSPPYDVLTWNTSNEGAVEYYFVERKKSDTTGYSYVSMTIPHGDSKYTQNVYKATGSYIYRLTPYYKDGTTGKTLSF